MTSYADTETVAAQVPLLTAWRHDPALNPYQLVHAVEPGEHVAECGVEVTIIGRSWPDPGTRTLQSRCSICAHAVEGSRATTAAVATIR